MSDDVRTDELAWAFSHIKVGGVPVAHDAALTFRRSDKVFESNLGPVGALIERYVKLAVFARDHPQGAGQSDSDRLAAEARLARSQADTWKAEAARLEAELAGCRDAVLAAAAAPQASGRPDSEVEAELVNEQVESLRDECVALRAGNKSLNSTLNEICDSQEKWKSENQRLLSETVELKSEIAALQEELREARIAPAAPTDEVEYRLTRLEGLYAKLERSFPFLVTL